jgi:hypothetical protein
VIIAIIKPHLGSIIAVTNVKYPGRKPNLRNIVAAA